MRLWRASLSMYWVSHCALACVTAFRHCGRCSAILSHSSSSRAVRKSHLMTSLNRSFGRPRSRLPIASSPYRMSFGRRPQGIRLTWPSHRNCRCVKMYNSVLLPVLLRTSALVILSFHVIPRIFRRQRK